MHPKVVKVTKTDYMLDNDDVYEHTFKNRITIYVKSNQNKIISKQNTRTNTK